MLLLRLFNIWQIQAAMHDSPPSPLGGLISPGLYAPCFTLPLGPVLLLEEKGILSLCLFRYIRAYNYSTKAVKWCRQLYSFFPPYIVFCISDTCRLKLIKINHNRTKSIIKINCVIDFYRFLIFFDWLVSTTIDNDWFLLTIEIIDMLRSD